MADRYEHSEGCVCGTQPVGACPKHTFNSMQPLPREFLAFWWRQAEKASRKDGAFKAALMQSRMAASYEEED
jgi:hypothetical protein